MRFDDLLGDTLDPDIDGPGDDVPGDDPPGPDEAGADAPRRAPIARVEPHGEVIRPGWQIPVIARIRWLDGRVTEVLAVATAWTRSAAEITWDAPEIGPSTDWIPTDDVRPAPPRRR